MSKAIILMYHHVAEVDIDPWALCVSPGHFAEHLEVLQKYRCMQIKELARIQQDGETPGSSVAVTFDDGYADNLYSAKPLLECYGIPGTVFPVTGHIGQEREFWWDELERILLRPGSLPEEMHLVVHGKSMLWETGDAAHYSEEDKRGDRSLKAWEGKPGSRLSLYHSMWEKLRLLPEEERRIVFDEMLSWANGETKTRSSHRPLLPEEVCALQEGQLIEVGAHTVTHPLLSAREVSFQREEIWQSKAYLENLLGRRVASFSYRYGDYTMETVAVVREAGFNCACSTVADVVRRQADLFQLPRFQVENWGGEEFSKWLSRWFAE